MNTVRDRWVLPSGYYLDRVNIDKNEIQFFIRGARMFFKITRAEFEVLMPLGKKLEEDFIEDSDLSERVPRQSDVGGFQ